MMGINYNIGSVKPELVDSFPGASTNVVLANTIKFELHGTSGEDYIRTGNGADILSGSGNDEGKNNFG